MIFFSVQDLFVLIDGQRYYNQAWVWLVNKDYNFKVHYVVSSTVPCGNTSTFQIRFLRSGNTEYSKTSGDVLVTNGTMSGNTDICGANQSTIFTLSLPPHAGAGSWQWNINQAGWLINGNAPPVSTTSLKVTVTTPGQASSAFISVSGSFLCSTIFNTIVCNTIPPPSPTVINKYRLGSSCYYYLTTNSNTLATAYEWSCNSGFNGLTITTTPTTQTLGVDCPDLLQDTYVPTYVRYSNACGHSNYKYQNIYFPEISGCMIKIINDEDSAIEVPNSLKSSVIEKTYDVYQLSPGIYKIIFKNIDLDRELNLYSLSGQALSKISSRESSSKIDLTARPKGIYVLSIHDQNHSDIMKLINY